jgi:hypothetical protein
MIGQFSAILKYDWWATPPNVCINTGDKIVCSVSGSRSGARRSKQERKQGSKQASKIEDEADVVFNTADFQLRTLFHFSP